MIHPRKDDQGQIVTIKTPDLPSPISSWSDPLAIATAVPDGPMPPAINGILLAFSSLFPPSNADWGCLAAQTDFEDPPFDTGTLKPAAGAVVVEPDGRLWLVSPTNGFGGYKTTFAKGKTDGRGLRETALKEVFEELGLEVELFRHLIDVTKSTSRTRYYLARRIGGNPAGMCWESQSAHLVPLELAKDMLNQSVDHQVIDALFEHWECWGGWFFDRDSEDPTWEAAKSGKIPATRSDWPNIRLPLSRTRITLDVTLSKREADNLKIGFIPRMMEQKWFAYFEDDVLYEHRSWTGFCISEIHFIPDGDGLRATYADVNRESRQYGNCDDEEDRTAIENRIRQLANLTEADRNAEDPMVSALQNSMVPNYLGNPEVVRGLLESFFQKGINQRLALLGVKDLPFGDQDANATHASLARIFAGEDPNYAVIGAWNTSDQLGSLVMKTLDLDPDWYADENLCCILSEGLAGVGIVIGTMVSDFWKDPGGRFKEDLLPKLGELLHFTASVLMGTQAVLFPDRTLADFKYLPHPSTPMDGDLFDIDPNDEDEDEEAESSKEGGGEEDEGLEEEWDADEILAARKAFGLIPDTPPNEALKEGLGMLSGHDDSREIFEMERAFGLLPSFPILEKESVAHEQKLPKKMGHPITLPGPIGELAKKIGGVGILANEVGVSTRTLSRWAKVGITSKMGMKLLVQLCNCHQVNPAGLLNLSTKE